MGASTLTCLDRDGDGYGTGPGCLGPDSDDLDATIHTGAQLVTKYGTLSAAINHLEGYTPAHIWYLAPATPTARCIANGSSAACTGNDANTPCNTVTAPCLTQNGLGGVTAGDAVVFRDGWNGRYSSGSGASGKPLILLGYPGELPVIDRAALAGAVIITQGQSWLIVDGFKTANYSQMQGGDNNYVENPHSFHDNVFKHIEGTSSLDGFGPTAGAANLTIEDSVFHDNTSAVNGQAGIYIGGSCVPATGLTVQRVISYNNAYSGIHFNAGVNGSTVANSLVYGNSIEGIAFESGVNTSAVKSNVVFDDNGAEFELYSYQNSLGQTYACDAMYYDVSAATWAGGTSTFTPVPHGLGVGQTAYVTGISPSGFNCPNGCRVTANTGTQISYAVANNPGAYVSGGGLANNAADSADGETYTISNATWSGGTATITVQHHIVPGQYLYITGITPSGFNCTGTGSPNSGTGCAVTSVTNTTVSYALPNPGSAYVAGGTSSSGNGDQANNLIENNTFYHNQYDINGAPVGVASAVWTSSHSAATGLQVVGDLGHNTFRNNIAVNFGDLSSTYRYAPIGFNDSWAAAFLATDIFDHNLTFQTNGIDSTTAAYGLVQTCFPTCLGYAVYDGTGAALNGGPALSSIAPGYTITGGADGNPSFVSASPSYYNTPSLFNFGLLAGSRALNSGSGVGMPAYDLFGNSFASTPSIGGIQQTTAVSPSAPPTPPTVSIAAPAANSTVSGTVAASASANASGTLSVTSVQFLVDNASLGSASTPFGPYTVSWDTTKYTNGSHTLTAVATDSGGNTATSSISVVVNNVVISSPPSSGAAWQDLANTQLKNVCPADGFNGINYAFADHCSNVVAAWSGAAADTKRNRLIIWGGGHVDYSGNEVYSLNLGTASPTLTRLTNPSDFTQNPAGCPDTNTVDGTPVSRHTYGGLVYLPVQDKMFSFGGALAPCGGPISTHTYTLDLSQATPTWQAMDPVNGFNPLNGYWTGTAVCAYDPNTQTVICSSAGFLLRYAPATNTYTLLNAAVQPIPFAAFGAIDPKRKLFIFMGTAYESTTPYVVAVDISAGSNFTAQDWSSQVTGCSALASANYPGLTYDSVLDRIVGWPNSGNTVYLFDPDTKTCTAQTLPNGPTNAASTTGTFGRFQYFPGLNAYGVVSMSTLDAYKLTLSTANLTAPAAQPSNPCDLNSDGVVNALDVQLAINQSLGIAACGNAALQQAGQCNVVDVQRVINASLGGACLTGQ